jgi:hypothetical protein
VENYRPGKKYFPAGIESKPGMKEALYYSDRKVATISYKDDRNITLKMHGYFATLCRSQERSWSETRLKILSVTNPRAMNLTDFI